MKQLYPDYICHHGTKGQKWGVRRWQYKDGSLTPAGYRHYGIMQPKKRGVEKYKTNYKNIKKLSRKLRRTKDEELREIYKQRLAEEQYKIDAERDYVTRQIQAKTNLNNVLDNYNNTLSGSPSAKTFSTGQNTTNNIVQKNGNVNLANVLSKGSNVANAVSSAAAYSGDMNQKQADRVLKNYKENKFGAQDAYSKSYVKSMEKQKADAALWGNRVEVGAKTVANVLNVASAVAGVMNAVAGNDNGGGKKKK